LYQDIADVESHAGKCFTFGCWVNASRAGSTNLRIAFGTSWATSAANKLAGQWEYLSLQGKIPPGPKARAHIYVEKQATASIDGACFLAGTEDQKRQRIEFVCWEAWNRLVYRCAATDIAMTFGRVSRDSWTAYNIQNVFTFDYEKNDDYFCIPDDVMIAWDDRGSCFTRSGALKWALDYGMAGDGSAAFAAYRYEPSAGFHPFVAEAERLMKRKLNWLPPPANITMRYEIRNDLNASPVRLTIRNTAPSAIHFAYVFQDAAYLTQGAPHQQSVHQYWPDGANSRMRYRALAGVPDGERVFGYYSFLNGGIFAGYWAPAKCAQAVAFASMPHCVDQPADETFIEVLMQKEHGSVPPEFNGGLGSVNAPAIRWEMAEVTRRLQAPTSQPFESSGRKVLAVALDFGALQPGQEQQATIYRIMFTGFADEAAMKQKLNAVLAALFEAEKGGAATKR
jgi:hypothetical protein